MTPDYDLPLSSFLYEESQKKENISNLRTKFNGYVVSTINEPKEKMYKTIIYSEMKDDPKSLNNYCVESYTSLAAFKEHTFALEKIYPHHKICPIWQSYESDKRQLSSNTI